MKEESASIIEKKSEENGRIFINIVDRRLIKRDVTGGSRKNLKKVEIFQEKPLTTVPKIL